MPPEPACHLPRKLEKSSVNGARGDEQIDTAHYCSGSTLAARRPAGWFKSEAIDRWARQGQAGCMNGDDPAARPDQPACRGESERRRVLIAPREKRGGEEGGSIHLHIFSVLMATPLICPPGPGPPPHSPAGLLLSACLVLPQNPKKCYSTYPIECLRPVHGVLNVDEKKLIAQFGGKLRDERFEPN